MTETSVRILVIDDDSDIGELITATAEGMGFTCAATTIVDDFIAAINPNITLIMLDLMMPNMDGIELLRILGQQQCKSNIILMSGVDRRVLENAQDMANSLGLPIIGIIQKPFRIVELEKTLSSIKELPRSTAKGKPKYDLQKPMIEITKDALQIGIEREEFVLHYQPQIEITTNLVVGLEALVRWQHKEHGLIFPDAFISKAEEFGLIDQIGWLVANKGLSEIKRFTTRNGLIPTLSLNVSPYSLHDLKFPDSLSIIAKQNQVDPENVILEITESGLLRELTSALDILTRLRMKNFKLSIDDFGTGYAMMEQLRHVPATELKIDKSLVQDRQDSTQIIIKKIIEMGHELGMNIIAEGVETAEQLQFLRNNNCDIVQGYFFSKPLPIEELLDWIWNFENKTDVL